MSNYRRYKKRGRVRVIDKRVNKCSDSSSKSDDEVHLQYKHRKRPCSPIDRQRPIRRLKRDNSNLTDNTCNQLKDVITDLSIWNLKFSNGEIIRASTIGVCNQNAYIAGYFTGEICIGTTTLSTDTSAEFLSVVNSNGTVISAVKLWTYAGTNTLAQYSRISFDSDCNVYLIGLILGTITLSNGQTVSSSNGTSIVMKINTSGEIEWFQQIFNSFPETNSIATDQSGNSYIAGTFEGTIRIGCPPGESTSTLLPRNFYLAKLNSSGTVVWIRVADGKGSANANDVIIDSLNRIVVTGAFSGNISIDGTFVS
jgi:hypothetical protein